MNGLRRRTVLLAAGAIAGLVIVAAVVVRPGNPGPPVPWTRLATDDVHSLAFAAESTDRLYFGHHGGILESSDDGRTIAVVTNETDFYRSDDGGRSWPGP